ncbi:MAG: helix-turn-helix domain-containing protein [Planctomycetota bacterium]|jgi:hypothetical protein
MSEERSQATLADVAREAGVDESTARQILGEVAGHRHSKELQDKVFSTARKIGYDLKKLKIGKRMDLRGQVYEEVLKNVLSNPDWDRPDIIRFLESGLGLVKRVKHKSFPDEFKD